MTYIMEHRTWNNDVIGDSHYGGFLFCGIIIEAYKAGNAYNACEAL